MKEFVNLISLDSTEISIKSDILFQISGLPITAPMITAVLITILGFVFCLILRPKVHLLGVPGKTQTVLEILYMYLYNLTVMISGSEKVARKIMPMIIAIFLYIGIANTITILLPILGPVTYDGKAIFATSTKDLNTTFGIGATVILSSHVMSIVQNNPIGHIFKFVKLDLIVNGFRKSPMDGILGIVDFLIGGLDIISEFAKTLSISLRLFGNMFAGEVLATLMMGAIGVVAPVILLGMGVFSGVLQALVFTALSASYFGGMLGGSDKD